MRKKLTLMTIVMACLLIAGGSTAVFADVPPYDYGNWMSYLPDDMLINEINMPGTHDSGTRYCSSLASEPFARAQDWTIKEQLENGIRVLDVRLNIPLDVWNERNTGTTSTWERLYVYHGPIVMLKSDSRSMITAENMSLADIIEWTTDFLKDHDKEVVVIKLQEEGGLPGPWDQATMDALSDFRKHCKEEYERNHGDVPYVFYAQGDKIPTLHDVRGRIVFLTNEKDHGTDQKTYTKFEDHCDVMASWKKIWLSETFDRSYTKQKLLPYKTTFGADKDNDDSWDEPRVKLVHTSSNTAPDPRGRPSAVAEAINPWVENYPFVRGNRYGWILMDFPTEKMIDKVIQTNIFDADNAKKDLTIKYTWLGGGEFDPDTVKYHVESMDDHTNWAEYTPEKKDVEIKGDTVTIHEVPFYELFDTQYKVVIDEQQKGIHAEVTKRGDTDFEIKVKPPSRKVNITINWDHLPYHKYPRWLKLVYDLTPEDGEPYTLKGQEVVVNSDRTTTSQVVSYFADRLQPMDYTLTVDPECIPDDISFDPDKDIKRTGTDSWEITFHSAGELKELIGSVKFVDGDGADRPSENSKFWQEMIAQAVIEGSPGADYAELKYDYSHWWDDGVVDVYGGKVPVYESGEKIDWTLSIPEIKGYDVEVDGMNAVLTRSAYMDVQLNWIGDTEDQRPETARVQLLRINGDTGARTVVQSEMTSARRNWHVKFAPESAGEGTQKKDSFTAAVVNVPLGYKASAAKLSGDGSSLVIDIFSNSETSISGNVTWYYSSLGRKLPKVEAVLLRNGEEFDREEISKARRTYEFTDLEPYDENNEPYEYTVTVSNKMENPLDKNTYAAIMDGNDIYVYPITSLSGTVSWKTKNDKTMDRPDWITDHPKLTLMQSSDSGRTYMPTSVEPVWDGENFVFEDMPYVAFKNGLPTNNIMYYGVDQEKLAGFKTQTVNDPQYISDGGVWEQNVRNTLNSTAKVKVPFSIKIDSGKYHPDEIFEVELKDDSGKTIDTAKCTMPAGSAESDVQTIDLNFDRAGSYTYTLHQKAGDGADWEYDTKGHEVRIDVTWDDVASELTCGKIEETVLHETYNYVPEPTSCDVKVVSEVVNLSEESTVPKDMHFIYDITGDDKQQVEIIDDGNDTFHLKFDKAGIYHYSISQRPANANGWVYDDEEYKLTVTVTENEKAKLTAKTDITPEFTFFNTYYGLTQTLQGEIEWNDNNGKACSRPDSMEVRLLETAEGEDPVVKDRVVVKPDKNGKWIYKFTVPSVAVQSDYSYSIEADEPDHYEMINCGTAIVNNAKEHGDWKYTLSDDGRTITAACGIKGCTDPAHSVSMTIKAENSKYTGKPYNGASLEGAEEFFKATGLKRNDIIYLQDGEEIDPPVKVGEYEAELILGELKDKDGQAFDRIKAPFKITHSDPVPEKHKVDFNMNDHGKKIENQTVKEGCRVKRPSDPVEKGWRFDGWYADEKLSTIFDFNTAITEDTTIYAKWTKISGGQDDPSKPSGSDTGDNSNPALYLMLMLVSGGALAGILVGSRRKKLD